MKRQDEQDKQDKQEVTRIPRFPLDGMGVGVDGNDFRHFISNHEYENRILNKQLTHQWKMMQKVVDGQQTGPHNETIRKAIGLIVGARDCGFVRFNHFLGDDGCIRVTLYHHQTQDDINRINNQIAYTIPPKAKRNQKGKRHYVEMTVETDGTVTLVYEVDDNRVIHETNMKYHVTKTIVKKIATTLKLYSYTFSCRLNQ